VLFIFSSRKKTREIFRSSQPTPVAPPRSGRRGHDPPRRRAERVRRDGRDPRVSPRRRRARRRRRDRVATATKIVVVEIV
jgi:hypothetical protein